MKNVVFDLDGALGYHFSADPFTGRHFVSRRFFNVLVEYCVKNRVRVYTCSSVMDAGWKEQWSGHEEHFSGHFKKSEAPPEQPDLVITSDGEFAKKFPSIMIPPDSDKSNKFIDLSVAGKLIELIKDRVVLNRQTTIEKVPSKEEQNKPPEDISRYGFIVK